MFFEKVITKQSYSNNKKDVSFLFKSKSYISLVES